MPTDFAASIWSCGKFSKAARQISALNEDVTIASVAMPAVTAFSSSPNIGRPKNSNIASVTAGVARMMLT